MQKKKKIFPKMKKKIKGFLTDESGKISKQDALGLAAGAALFYGMNDVLPASAVSVHTSSCTGAAVNQPSITYFTGNKSQTLYAAGSPVSDTIAGHANVSGINGHYSVIPPSAGHGSGTLRGAASTQTIGLGLTTQGHASGNIHSSHNSHGNHSSHANLCFTGDQLVLTVDGYKKIVDVRPGDSVISYNESQEELSVSIIDYCIIHDGISFEKSSFDINPLLEVVIEIDGNQTITKVTSNHFYYSPTHKKYIKIGEFKIGEAVQGEKSQGTILSMKTIIDRNSSEELQNTILYNLHMREHDNHNYFVQGTLVHNAKEEP